MNQCFNQMKQIGAKHFEQCTYDDFQNEYVLWNLKYLMKLVTKKKRGNLLILILRLVYLVFSA